MNKLLFWKLYSSDFEKLDRIFEDSLTILKRNNISIKDKTILEIGPGNSYMIAYNFLMHSAKKVIQVDKFQRTIKTKRQKEYFKREIEYVSKKYGQKPFFVNNGNMDLKIIYEKKQKENLADAKLCSEFKDKNKEDLQITFLSVLLQKSSDAIQNPQLIKNDNSMKNSQYRRSQ